MRAKIAVLGIITIAAAFDTALPATAGKNSEKLLYSFGGDDHSYGPYAGLTRDENGDLYGTTVDTDAGLGGTVFRFAHDGTLTTLFTFSGDNGSQPRTAMILDGKGNLFGTTPFGGIDCDGSGIGCGVVFKLAPDGTETLLHSFNGDDGSTPVASLIEDKKGNLYGTTLSGGASGSGVIFKISPKGKENILYSFAGGSDGLLPGSRLVRDKKGNLYGTTELGGAYDGGTVFKLAPDGTKTTVYSFSGSDGRAPSADLIQDDADNLYGTTETGGNLNCNNGSGCGTVFKLTLTGKETELYAFSGGADGQQPQGSIAIDPDGNIYGTTFNGGGACDCGTIFKVTANGKKTTLHAFSQASSDGYWPNSGVIRDAAGNLYGTTPGGGQHNAGVIFRMKEK